MRGAYIQLERATAARHATEDPVWPNFEATSEAYNRIIRKMILQENNEAGISLYVATHNRDSIQKAQQWYAMIELLILSYRVQCIYSITLSIIVNNPRLTIKNLKCKFLADETETCLNDCHVILLHIS